MLGPFLGRSSEKKKKYLSLSISNIFEILRFLTTVMFLPMETISDSRTAVGNLKHSFYQKIIKETKFNRYVFVKLH
jgi:hypothetical protein